MRKITVIGICFLLAMAMNVNAQVPLFDQSFTGGVVTRSFSPEVSSADSSGVQWDFSFPEGSTIIKAYLIAGRQGDAPPLDIKLNAFRVRFDDLTQVTPSFTSEFYGDSVRLDGSVAKVAAVHVADITTIVRPETDGMYLSIPSQSIVSRRYSDFTLFVAYAHPDLEPIHSTVVLNSQSFSQPTLDYTIPLNKYACGDVAFGFSAGYVCNNTFDKVSVHANGVFLGDAGGPERGSICAGPGAEFQLVDGMLTTTQYDNPNQEINESDLVSNLQGIIESTDTEVQLEFGTVSSNAVWALFLAYNTIPDTIEVVGDTAFCLSANQTTLIAPDGYTDYTWSDGTIGRTVFPSTSGTWTVSMVSPSGCSVALSQDITVYAETELASNKDTLDFGLVAGCTNSSEQLVEITNNGDSTIIFEDIVSSNSAFFLAESIESFALQPGESTMIAIQFSPGVPGTYTGELSVTALPCQATLTVVLLGRGQESLLRTSLTSVDFGYVPYCTGVTRDTTIVIYNDLNEVVVLSDPERNNGFDVVAPNFPVDVFARDSVKVHIRFAPQEAKRYSGVMEIPFRSFTCSDTLSVALSARSIQPRLQSVGASLISSPLPLCYDVPSGTLQLYNTDLVPVVINEVLYDSEFLLLNIEELPVTLAPERSVSIPVDYLQNDPGAFIGTISVLTGEECADTTHIPVGSTLVSPKLRVDKTVNFGDNASCDGNEFERVLAVSNITKENFGATIESVEIAGPFSSNIAIGDTLRPQTTESFAVLFHPPAHGDYTGQLILTYGPCAHADTITLLGSYGTVAAEASPVVQFEPIAVGQTAQLSCFVANTGEVAMSIDSITAPTEPFSIAYQSIPTPGMLEPGDTLFMLVDFTPQLSDSYEGLLSVHTASCLGDLAIDVFGDGYIPGAAPVVRTPFLEAVAGDTVYTPVLLERRGTLFGTDESIMHLTVELPYSQFLVLGVSNGVHSSVEYPNVDRQRLIVDSVRVAAGIRQGDTLTKILGVVLHGEKRVIPVELSSCSFTWNEGVEIAQTLPGAIEISEFCFGYSVGAVVPFNVSSPYPNPTSDGFVLDFADQTERNVHVSIFNIHGQNVYSHVVKQGTNSVVVRLPDVVGSGIYTLVVSDVYRSESMQVVVRR